MKFPTVGGYFVTVVTVRNEIFAKGLYLIVSQKNLFILKLGYIKGKLEVILMFSIAIHIIVVQRGLSRQIEYE